MIRVLCAPLVDAQNWSNYIFLLFLFSIANRCHFSFFFVSAFYFSMAFFYNADCSAGIIEFAVHIL